SSTFISSVEKSDGKNRYPSRSKSCSCWSVSRMVISFDGNWIAPGRRGADSGGLTDGVVLAEEEPQHQLAGAVGVLAGQALRGARVAAHDREQDGLVLRPDSAKRHGLAQVGGHQAAGVMPVHRDRLREQGIVA